MRNSRGKQDQEVKTHKQQAIFIFLTQRSAGCGWGREPGRRQRTKDEQPLPVAGKSGRLVGNTEFRVTVARQHYSTIFIYPCNPVSPGTCSLRHSRALCSVEGHGEEEDILHYSSCRVTCNSSSVLNSLLFVFLPLSQLSNIQHILALSYFSRIIFKTRNGASKKTHSGIIDGSCGLYVAH